MLWKISAGTCVAATLANGPPAERFRRSYTTEAPHLQGFRT